MQATLEYQFLAQFTWSYYAYDLDVHYTEYVSKMVTNVYFEALYTKTSHNWKLGLHLEGMVENIDSQWVRDHLRDSIAEYLSQPADNCQV